jgi:TPR repeat protein
VQSGGSILAVRKAGVLVLSLMLCVAVLAFGCRKSNPKPKGKKRQVKTRNVVVTKRKVKKKLPGLRCPVKAPLDEKVPIEPPPPPPDSAPLTDAGTSGTVEVIPDAPPPPPRPKQKRSAIVLKKYCQAWSDCPSSGAACAKIAVYYENGINYKGEPLLGPDPAKQKLFLQRACKGKHGPSCYQLFLEKHEKDPRFEKHQKELLSICEMKSGEACAKVAEIFLMGQTQGTDAAQQSYKYRKKACLLGDGPSCSFVARYLWKGISPVKKDLDKALVYYSVACKAGFSRGCFNKARVLLEQDEKATKKQALKLISVLCKQKDKGACALLGLFHLKGEERKKDAKKARKLFEAGCKENLGFACHSLASLFYNGAEKVRKNKKRAFKLFQKACKYGSAASCARLASFYKLGTGVRKNPKKRLLYLEAACGFYDSVSCSHLAYHFLRKKNYPRARDYFSQLCQSGDASACTALDKVPRTERRETPYGGVKRPKKSLLLPEPVKVPEQKPPSPQQKPPKNPKPNK